MRALHHRPQDLNGSNEAGEVSIEQVEGHREVDPHDMLLIQKYIMLGCPCTRCFVLCLRASDLNDSGIHLLEVEHAGYRGVARSNSDDENTLKLMLCAMKPPDRSYSRLMRGPRLMIAAGKAIDAIMSPSRILSRRSTYHVSLGEQAANDRSAIRDGDRTPRAREEQKNISAAPLAANAHASPGPVCVRTKKNAHSSILL